MTNLQDMFDNNSPFKFTSNKKVSEETRKKQSEAAKKRKAKESTKLKLSKIQKEREAKKKQNSTPTPNRKTIQTPDGVFTSIKEYAKFIGKHRDHITKLLKKYPDQYYVIKENQ